MGAMALGKFVEEVTGIIGEVRCDQGGGAGQNWGRYYGEY